MYNNTHRKIKDILSKNKGLTLVELMVVISIFLVITTVALFNYGNFNSSVSLQNLTDDIALSIRKAQSFAIGARGVGVDFKNVYGMHFAVDTNPTGSLSGSNKSFLMFSRPIKDNKKQYDDNSSMGDVCNDGSNECLELFSIMSADEVKGIVLDGDTPKTIGSIDIVFIRPNPSAYFCYRESSISTCNTSISRVGIIISNGQEGDKYKTKTISVQNTGQISIE